MHSGTVSVLSLLLRFDELPLKFSFFFFFSLFFKSSRGRAWSGSFSYSFPFRVGKLHSFASLLGDVGPLPQFNGGDRMCVRFDFE